MKALRVVKSLFQSPPDQPQATPVVAQPEPPAKTWEISQNYELEHAIVFMDTPDFRDLANSFHRGDCNMSNGFANELTLREFFGSSRAEWDKFVAHLAGKNCLEIGPCVLSPLAAWDVAAERHVVEPLLPPIEKWQRENLGFSLFEGLQNHPDGAEKLIPELVGKIDGAIFCRNCLDHTPHWPFILSNMSQYAAPGCALMLWLDLDHRGVADEGHYDITTDPPSFKRLVESLGFDVVREYEDKDRFELNWGCYAVKR